MQMLMSRSVNANLATFRARRKLSIPRGRRERFREFAICIVEFSGAGVVVALHALQQIDKVALDFASEIERVGMRGARRVELASDQRAGIIIPKMKQFDSQ